MKRSLVLVIIAIALAAMVPLFLMAHQEKPKSFDTVMHDAMQNMDHDMKSMKMSGNPDRDFVMMMIPHHQGAIDMAEAELAYGKDPEIRKMATDIIAAQKNEIAMMKQWLKAHPAPAMPHH